MEWSYRPAHRAAQPTRSDRRSKNRASHWECRTARVGQSIGPNAASKPGAHRESRPPRAIAQTDLAYAPQTLARWIAGARSLRGAAVLAVLWAVVRASRILLMH